MSFVDKNELKEVSVHPLKKTSASLVFTVLRLKIIFVFMCVVSSILMWSG